MLATRCKPRWPRAVATTVGSPFRGLIRHLGTTTTTTTTAHPEETGRDGDENRGNRDSSFRRVLLPSKGGSTRSPYVARAYEPEPFTYLDLITRVTSYPRHTTRQAVGRALRQLQKMAQRPQADGGGGPEAAAASDPPAGQPAAEQQPSSLPSEDVLDRAIHLLDGASAHLKPLLDAVSQDVSKRLVPRGHTHDWATLRSHHLGRWYADGWLGLQYEHRQISRYLVAVAAHTDKARRYVASSYVRYGNEALRVREEAVKRTVQQYQSEFEAVAYRIVLELEAARQAGQWRRAWALEKKLATTASLFLPSQPLASVWHILDPKLDKGTITEISMARMARWDDSYESLYAEDAETRGRMDLVMGYQAIFNRATYMNAKPWRGESPIYEVIDPTGTDGRLIVLRLDQRSQKPYPLWPRAWKPILRIRTGLSSEPAGAKGETEGRTTPTPPRTGRFRMRKIMGAHKVPKTKSKEKRSRDTRADSDIPEAWYGSLLSDDPS